MDLDMKILLDLILEYQWTFVIALTKKEDKR